MDLALPLLLAYAAGSISFAALVARLKGVDVRAHGSGNPGATNVGRVLGKGFGALVLVLDLAKGALPVLLLTAPLAEPAPAFTDAEGHTLLLAAAVLGHVLPVTSGFRGGKGVATYLGGCLALDPLSAVLAVVLHSVVKRLLGFVSIASLVLVWAVPLVLLIAGSLQDTPSTGWATLALLALLITVRHKDNLARIRAGREYRYDGPSASAQASSDEEQSRSPRSP